MARAFDERAPLPGGDTLHEACGVVGIYAPGFDVARLAYFGLYALQHRGQESAGIAVSDGRKILVYREMGLLSSIFDEEILARLQGYIAVGHTRYSTTGSSVVVNAQPLLERAAFGDVALAHNGNLTNTDELRDSLLPETTLQATSDSEVLAKAIVQAPGADIVARIRDVMTRAAGAYSIVMSTTDALYAFRDPWGVRPLCYGRNPGGGYVFASESCALATVGAKSCGSTATACITTRSLSPSPKRFACSNTSTSRVPTQSSTIARFTWRGSRWVGAWRASIRSPPMW